MECDVKPCNNKECRHNLLELYAPEQEITYTCVLDVVEDNPDGMTLEGIGDLLGISAEAVRQTQDRGIRRIKGEVKPVGRPKKTPHKVDLKTTERGTVLEALREG